MNSLTSLVTSRKTIRVLIGIVIIIGGLYFMWPTFTTADAKMKAFVGAMLTIGGLLGVDVHGIAKEDAAAKASPAQQVNVGSKVDNVVPPAAVVPPPAPAVSPQEQLVEDVYAQVLHRLEARAAVQNKARAAALAAQQAAAANAIPEPPKG